MGPRREDPIYEVARILTSCNGAQSILSAIERAFVRIFGIPLAIFLPGSAGLCTRHHSPDFDPDQADVATASLAMSSGQPGSNARARFIPLKTWEGAIGVIGYRTDESRIPRPNRRLLTPFAHVTTLAVLRAGLQETASRAVTLPERTLLNSIAHNVRTPLASIIGVLSTLQEEQDALNENVRRELIDTAQNEAERLNRLLGNLLDLSRLEAGALHARVNPCDIEDVIGAALEQLGAAARARPIEIRIAPDLPFVHVDFVLIVQVLVNLLDNAIKYSANHAPIGIDARIVENRVEVCVSDVGQGIAEQDLTAIFEKFNRAGRTGETGGIGLGLSISKGLIEAHRGSIWAQRRHPHGTAVTFALPVERLERSA